MRIFAGVVVMAACLLTGCGPTAQQVAVEQQRVEQARLEAQRTQYKAAIEQVLTQDDGTVAIPDVGRRIHVMRNIDTSQCPSEFRSAYLDHTDAWQQLARVKQARQELASEGSIEDTLLRSMFASASGSSDTPLEDLLRTDAGLQRVESNASQRVEDTFTAVQRIAIQYGAALPVHS